MCGLLLSPSSESVSKVQPLGLIPSLGSSNSRSDLGFCHGPPGSVSTRIPSLPAQTCAEALDEIIGRRGREVIETHLAPLSEEADIVYARRVRTLGGRKEKSDRRQVWELGRPVKEG